MILKISLIIIILGIAYLSLTPTETITIGSDKISHLIAYGILMLNVGLLTFPKQKPFFLGIIFTVLYGILMEIAQYYVPGRYMSVYDILANIGGVSIGVLLLTLFHRRMIWLLNKARII